HVVWLLFSLALPGETLGRFARTQSWGPHRIDRPAESRAAALGLPSPRRQPVRCRRLHRGRHAGSQRIESRKCCRRYSVHRKRTDILNRRPLFRTLFFLLLCAQWMSAQTPAQVQQQGRIANPVVLMLIIGAISLAPFLAIMMTSFVKISVVLSLI